jgi:SnoaL-like domain
MDYKEMLDRLSICELIENWVLWRDSGDWERFSTVWHEDGYMMATWFQGPANEFIQANRVGWDRGVSILHFLGGKSIEVNETRAVAQTKMTISQRAPVHDIVCDVVCTGRFYDFFEKRNAKWGLVLRQPIYEKDRLDPVDSSKTLSLDRTLLERYPEGYRHLAYLQKGIGYEVKMDMPGLKGPEVEALYAMGKRWLDGGALHS